MPFPSSVVPTTVQSTLDEYCRGLLTTEINSGRLTQQQAGMLMDEISRLIPQTAHNIENEARRQGQNAVDDTYVQQNAMALVETTWQRMSQPQAATWPSQQNTGFGGPAPWGGAMAPLATARQPFTQPTNLTRVRYACGGAPATPASTPEQAPAAAPVEQPIPVPTAEPVKEEIDTSQQLTASDPIIVSKNAQFAKYKCGRSSADKGVVKLIHPMMSEEAAMSAAQALLSSHPLDNAHLIRVSYDHVVVGHLLKRRQLETVIRDIGKLYKQYSNEPEKLMQLTFAAFATQTSAIGDFLKHLFFTTVNRAFAVSAMCVSEPKCCALDDFNDVRLALRPDNGHLLQGLPDDDPEGIISRPELTADIMRRVVHMISRITTCNPATVSGAIIGGRAMDRSGIVEWRMTAGWDETLFSTKGTTDARDAAKKKFADELDKMATVMLIPREFIYTTCVSPTLLQNLHLSVPRDDCSRMVTLNRSTIAERLLAATVQSVHSATADPVAMPLIINIGNHTRFRAYTSLAVGGHVVVGVPTSKFLL